MYNCGPTVWDFAHIGNFRTSIFVDILRRYLIFKGYRVTHVTNITDVDDRIIQMAAQKNVSLDEYTAPYLEAFWQDFDALGCQRPEIAPRATQHIPEMEQIVKGLMERGCAYESEDSYYFRITSFPDYGKLSKINFAGNIAGASERVDTDKYDKEDARDFVLWKAQKSPDEPAWVTALGSGRPGWHIECSAMSMKYLGETFDIHCGGVDLIFPHHENEIAQSEGATGKPFVNYWLHGEHLKINGESMSKSKGNYYTYRDLARQGFTPAAIRYALFSAPYRKQINFTLDGLRGHEKTVASLQDFRARLEEARTEPGSNPQMRSAAARALEEFTNGLDDDLNTSVALAAVHNLSREVNTALDNHALRADDQRDLL
ncbi:MAG: cysteinyl-tRNA synthetase, partial [Pyrinomonadaceae bacterium]|nr:cysteinyl-tRNA synthetase [Pyrinomonadaceae bacterium]